jgi:hypothetical protein
MNSGRSNAQLFCGAEKNLDRMRFLNPATVVAPVREKVVELSV